jgi:hypothetical protein
MTDINVKIARITSPQKPKLNWQVVTGRFQKARSNFTKKQKARHWSCRAHISGEPIGRQSRPLQRAP